MGQRGISPKPTALKIVQGVQESRINRNEPVPDTPDVIKPPPGMPAKARAVWKSLAPDLQAKGVLTSWDTHALELYCCAVSDWHAIRKAMGTDFVVEGSMGQEVSSPRWRQMNDAAALVLKFGAKLGLTPSDRSAIIATGEKDLTGSAERFFA